jgi:hypothetical protein
LLEKADAVRVFPALAPYFAECERMVPTAPPGIERLSAQIERSFPSHASGSVRAAAGVDPRAARNQICLGEP